MAGSPQAMWNRYGVEATAVARSVQCQVPLLPSRSKPDMPSPPKKDGTKGIQSTAPGSGWSIITIRQPERTIGSARAVTGTKRLRRGPGYYTKIGTDVRKLEPGL